MANWAAIVYGRTYQVDFRFIATPEDFQLEDKNWANNYIRISTRSAERLSENPRWSLFKNDKHCVIGVTCMVKELISSKSETAEDFTRDQNRRPLYVFVGYVAKVDRVQGLPPLPPYSDRNLELFKPLYDSYVRPKWLVKSYEEASKVAVPSSYEGLTYSEPEVHRDLDRIYFSLNQAHNQAYLWSDIATEREKLWVAASQQLTVSPQAPLSLCFGLATKRDVLEGPVLNATSADVRQKEILPKRVEAPVSTPVEFTSSRNVEVSCKSERDSLQVPTKKEKPAKKKIECKPTQLFGGILGGMIPFLILYFRFWMGKSLSADSFKTSTLTSIKQNDLTLSEIIKTVGFSSGTIILGSGLIGWIIAGWISEALKDGNSRANKSVPLAESPAKQEITYGFKERNRQDSPHQAENSGDSDSDWL